MAWISVHEQVLGGKLRGLAKELDCSQNEALGLLVRFWLWGIRNADSEGFIQSATKDDLAEELRVGLDRRLLAEQAVEAMIIVGWIDEVGDKLYIHDWSEWQKQWYKALDVRKKDSERQAKYRARRAEAAAGSTSGDSAPQPVKNADSSDSKGENPTNPTQEGAKKATNAYSTGFEEFWKVYPRKRDKGNAYKCYNARLKDGWSPAELLEAATNYALEMERKHTEQQYIKHAATFLSATTPFAEYVRSRGDRPAIADDDDPFKDWRQ